LSFEALKGYDHYPCLRKLMNLSRQNSRQLSSSAIATVALLLTYVCQGSRGDLDYLRLHFDELARHEIVASAEDCLKHKCRYYRCCLLHGARHQAASADIVLTNQALLFCDLVTDGGILPPIRHWVIDEAHGLEAEARQQLSATVSVRELLFALDSLLGSRGQLARLRDAVLPLAGGNLLAARIDAALSEAAVLPTICVSFASELKDLSQLAEQSDYDRVNLWINEEIRQTAPWGALASAAVSLARRLEIFWKDCRDLVALANQFGELVELQADLAGSTAELGQALTALTLILNGDDPDYVYSADLDRKPESKNDRLLAERFDVGEVLAERFFPETASVIFTSATLATGTGFDYFAQACGLSRLASERWRCLQLDSSYDFEHNMSVYLPNDLPEPNMPGYHAALEELLFHVHRALGGSVLTLFTNRRDMERLFNSLRPRLEAEGIRLRCQWRGQNSRRLSEEFLADRELSLFALRSFWQGFDAPGDTLRCVVVPKLPFGRPTDPLSRERDRRERDAWKRYVLPEAVIDLKQAAGRLIRSSTDRGALVLADSRLLSKWYGREFLQALPSQQRYTLSSAELAEALGRADGLGLNSPKTR
jgi:ATP-dependent DNA helicase DinG